MARELSKVLEPLPAQELQNDFMGYYHVVSSRLIALSPAGQPVNYGLPS